MFKIDTKSSEHAESLKKQFENHLKPQLPSLLRVATYMTHNHAQAEDLVQEAALRAQKSFKRFKLDTNFQAWLFTILKNAHIDMLRREKKFKNNVSIHATQENNLSAPTESEAFFMQEDSPELILNRFEDQVVIDALKKIPLNIRLTLLLVDVEQLNHADAASALNVPVGTIKSRTHRGRAMLRNLLYQYAIENNIASKHTSPNNQRTEVML
ncbi:sigma-70 family RNA polymerase sigma factor [Poriferisphaera corsica]|nr:sigma-70 family RNA polymerase sigma factor [Poriferisphaera corsica]